MLNLARKVLQHTLFKFKAGNRRSAVEINHYSYTLLTAQLQLPVFVPYTSWAISPTGLLHILNYISIYKPRGIVELGTGMTSLYIRRLIEQLQLNTILYSVDHDPAWIHEMQTLSNKVGIHQPSGFIEASLKNEYFYKQHPILWFDSSTLDSQLPLQDIELIIIDAPPGKHRFSRSGAFIYFKDLIANSRATFFLDDVNRAEEKEILKSLDIPYTQFLDYAMGGKMVLPFDTAPVSLYK